jgi:hypothetical protein
MTAIRPTDKKERRRLIVFGLLLFAVAFAAVGGFAGFSLAGVLVGAAIASW